MGGGWYRLAPALLAGCLVVACGGGGGGGGSNGPPGTTVVIGTGTPPPASTASLGAGSSPQTAAFAAIAAGYSGSVTIPATAGGSGTIAATLAASAPAGTPIVASTARRPLAIGGNLTAVLYVAFTANATLTFPSTPGFTFSGVTVPVGTNAYVGLYDPTNSSWTTFAGPAGVNGTTLTFAGVARPVTFVAGDAYAFAVFITTQSLTAPTPAPQATPTPTPSPSPNLPAQCPATNAPQITIAPTAFSLNGVGAVAYASVSSTAGAVSVASTATGTFTVSGSGASSTLTSVALGNAALLVTDAAQNQACALVDVHTLVLNGQAHARTR